MSLTDTQYLALSQLAYEDIPSTAKGEPLSTLLALDPPIFSFLTSSMIADLSSLTGWILLDFQANSSSGFAGLAIQGPSSGPSSPGEIAFGFRGTEVGGTESLITGIQDIYSDLLLALPDAPIGQPNQFRDAYTFVKDVIEDSVGSSLTNSQLSDYVTTNETLFTGHSLGGGLAQYIIYELDAGSAVTFNAVGIGQVLDISNPHYYDSMITDYVNAGDVIGNYGTQLGQTVLLEGATSLASFDQQEVVYILSILTSISNSEMTVAEAIPLLKDAFDNMDSATSDYLFGGGFIDTHNISGLGSLTEYSSSISIGPILNQVTALALAIANSPVPNLIESLTDLLTSTVALADSVTDFGSEISNLVNDTAVDAVEDVSDLVDSTITNLEATIIAMNGDFSTIATEVGDLFSDIQDDIAEIIQNASIDLASQALLAVEGFSDLFDSLNIVDASRNIALKILNGQDVSSAIYSELQTNIGSAIDGLEDVAVSINGMATTVAASVAAAVISIEQEVTDHLDRIYPAVESLLVNAVGSATLFANSVATTITNLADDFTDFGSSFVDSFTDFSETFTTNLAAAGAGLGDTLTFAGELASDTYQNVISAGGAALNGVYALITGQNIFAVDENGTIIGTSSNDNIFGFSGNNYIDAGAGNDSIDGAGGNDTIFGNSGDDIIIGGAGSDIINGDSGNDTLNGGSGNDTLRGGASNDTYVFGRGYGNDVIDDYLVTFTNPWYYQHDAGFDTISFLGGVAPEDIEVRRSGDDLIFSIVGTSDTLTVQGYFIRQSNGSLFNAIEQVTFADTNQTVWSQADLLEKARYINGTEDADYLVGYDYQDDVIVTGDGNDTVSNTGNGEDYVLAGNGNDTITMGSGNGYADGEAGNDTLNGGAGNDALVGGIGTDTLNGDSGNDVLDGGADNDLLRGGADNDTYKFGLGYGQDTIVDEYVTFTNPWYYQHDAGVDTISFMEGVSPEDIEVTRNANDLIFTITGTTDVLTVQGYFNRQSNGSLFNAIEQVTFADLNETTWTQADLLEKARYINGTEGADYLVGYDYQDDIIVTGGGNDTISDTGNGADNVLAGDGNDTITMGGGDGYASGEAGNDTLYGGAGNDTLLGGEGTDTLNGGSGNDTLSGGTDNDILKGDSGDDTYQFGLGSGQDTILDEYVTFSNPWYYQHDGGYDTISFTSGVEPQDVDVKRSGNDLVFTILGTDDVLTVQGFYNRQTNGSLFNAIEQVTFNDANETIWTQADLIDKARYIYGTENNDTITGFEYQDDIISSGDGNDLVNGTGTGTDTVYAGAGNDTVYMGSGDGEVNGEDGNDILYGNGGNDTVLGGEGDDTLHGDDLTYYGLNNTSGNDILNGGQGSDQLFGGGGDDIYQFNLGDGQDTILDSFRIGYPYSSTQLDGGYDVIQFGEGIEEIDVQVSRTNTDLVLSIAGTLDSLTIQNFFLKDSNGDYLYGIEKVQFSDANNTIWNQEVLFELARQINGTSNNDILTGYSDQNNILLGLGSDDLLYGNSADDYLDGGAGDDTLYGGTGNDKYIFEYEHGIDTIVDPKNHIVNSTSVDGGFDIIDMGHLRGIDVRVTQVNDDLEIAVAGMNSKLIVKDYFVLDQDNNPAYPIEEIHFVYGQEVWTSTEVIDHLRYIYGTSTDDYIYGVEDRSDVVMLEGGNDTYEDNGYFGDSVFTQGGDTTLYLGYGSDSASLSHGADTVYGRGGNDYIYSGANDDVIYGDRRSQYAYDVIDAGDDYIVGDSGSDLLYGDGGNDTYVFSRGADSDIIVDESYVGDAISSTWQSGGYDTIQFTSEISPEDISFVRDGDNLKLFIAPWDNITVQGFFARNTIDADQLYNGVERIVFDSYPETIWYQADILEKVRYINGTEGDDEIVGFDGNGDILTESGTFSLEGSDIIKGGIGNDDLSGGDGDDVYLFEAGDGNDVINDTSGDDIVSLGQSYLDTIFSQVGDDLQITVAGSSDSITVSSWFTNSSSQIEMVEGLDGSLISNTQIELLIQAMATYSSNNNNISWTDALSTNSQDVQNVLTQYWTPPTI